MDAASQEQVHKSLIEIADRVTKGASTNENSGMQKLPKRHKKEMRMWRLSWAVQNTKQRNPWKMKRHGWCKASDWGGERVCVRGNHWKPHQPKCRVQHEWNWEQKHIQCVKKKPSDNDVNIWYHWPACRTHASGCKLICVTLLLVTNSIDAVFAASCSGNMLVMCWICDLTNLIWRIRTKWKNLQYTTAKIWWGCHWFAL